MGERGGPVHLGPWVYNYVDHQYERRDESNTPRAYVWERSFGGPWAGDHQFADMLEEEEVAKAHRGSNLYRWAIDLDPFEVMNGLSVHDAKRRCDAALCQSESFVLKDEI